MNQGDIESLMKELRSLDFSIIDTDNFQQAEVPVLIPKSKPRREYPVVEKLESEVAQESELNHVILARDVLIEKGQVGKVNANMNAYLLSKQLEEEGRNPTKAEKKILARYTGWGGLAKFLRQRESGGQLAIPSNLLELTKLYLTPKEEEYTWHKVKIPPLLSLKDITFESLVQGLRDVVNNSYQVKNRIFYSSYNRELTPEEARLALIKALLSQEEFNSAISSTINAHYTSREVISSMWKFIQDLGYEGGTVLESSAGIGHFFGLMPLEIRKKSKLIGIEKDLTSGRILRQLYPQAASIQIKGFEEADIPYGKIDLVIGNVPFGAKDLTPYDPYFKSITKFSLHNYFIAKSLLALRSGGLAMLITSMSTLDGSISREFRNWATSEQGGNSDFLGALRLPANAFKENAGTEVTTDIIIFRKRGGDGESHPQKSDFTSSVKIGEAPRAENTNLLGDTVTIQVNEFFALNPNLMLGEMVLAHEAKIGGLYHKDEQVLIAPDNQDFSHELTKAFKMLSGDLGNIFSDLEASRSDMVEEEDTGMISEEVGELAIRGKKVYVVAKDTIRGGKVLEEIPNEEIKTKLKGKHKTVPLLELIKDYQSLKLAQRDVMEKERKL